ncbi:MAG: AMP-binding protein [Clostridia bacterium]
MTSNSNNKPLTVETTKIKTPWYSQYDSVRSKLEYPTTSMIAVVEGIAEKYPKYYAYEFMNKNVTYARFIEDVKECAKALKAIGIKENDRVTICLPNCPQGIIMFYAINMIGAVANMIHPLSSIGEIIFFLTDSKSVAAITLDQFYSKFEEIQKTVRLPHLIISSIKDVLSPVMKVGYAVTEGRKIDKIPEDAKIVWWKDFLKAGASYTGKYKANRKANDPAAILYSGGTTGTTKGILLSNLNFNSLAVQIIEMAVVYKPGDTMLAVMPIFHGFGLGVCIHSMLANGAKSILIPRFNIKAYAKLLKSCKPNFIAGVPTIYEAVLRNKDMEKVDFSFLKGVFSGGDSLSIELKKKFDIFLKEHNASTQIREGYGTTECVTASCLTPYNDNREGSIGIPFPDTYYKIVKVDTTDEVPYGEEGEICLTGPSMMIEYVNQPNETANTLKKHSDGMTWLHTGDLGTMDTDGFVYFKQRIKRMIISSGYSIYPSQLENIIEAHESVLLSCVIGVSDPYKMQKVKAFVMLKPGVPNDESTKNSLFEHCKRNIAKYSMPYDIEIRDELPKTLVGKVAYRILEEEENARINAKTEEQASCSI